MDSNTKPSYQPWNEEEFQSDVFVRGMTYIQRWMYRSLLQSMFFHSTRPYLPNDDDVLWVLAGAESKEMWSVHKPTLLKRFNVCSHDHNLLENKRVKADWSRLTDARVKMSELGVKSAAVRKLFKGKEEERTFNAGSTHVDSTFNEKSTSKSKSKRESESKSDSQSESQSTSHNEEPMSVRNSIIDLSREILGVKISRQDKGWSDITDLNRVYSPYQITTAFEDWARSKQGEAISYPLSAFIKVADAALRGDIVLATSPDTHKVVTEMAFISQNSVVPNDNQAMVIARWLRTYTADEIISAFRSFYTQIQGDDYQTRFAAKHFCETGEARIETERRNRAEAIAEEKLRLRGQKELQAKAAERIRQMESVVEEVGDPRLFDEQ